MTSETEDSAGAEGDPGAARLTDALISGLNHALSNRITALQGIAAQSADEAVRTMVDAEGARFEQLLFHYRVFESSRSERPEAVLCTDAVADAGQLLAFHPILRDVTAVVSRAEDSAAAVVPRRAYTKAVLAVLCDVAARVDLGADDRRVLCTDRRSGEWAEVIVHTASAADAHEVQGTSGYLDAARAWMPDAEVTSGLEPSGRYSATIRVAALRRR